MLKISRSDISSTEITEFDIDRRFLKLPIQGYLEMLEFGGKNAWEEINAPQIAMINAVNNPAYRFIVGALSRRLGKTFIANIIGQLVSLMPGCNILIMSPNYTLSQISFDIQRKLIKHFDIEVTKDNLKDKIIETINGSTIRMGSLSTVDSCVGRSYDLIIFDEAALGADARQAFEVALRPTLDKPNSKAVFISTPRGKLNWFSEYWDRGWSSEYPAWASIQADYRENHRLTEEDIKEARSTMSAANFEQEYMASFTVFEGQVFSFDAEVYVKEFNRLEGTWEFLGGLDPGYKDPTAMCVIAYNNDQNIFWIVDEYQESGKVTSEHALQIQALITEWDIDAIFIDSAAAQFAADLAYEYDIATIRAKKQKLEGIAYMQNLVEQGRLYVDPKCVVTLGMLDQYRWDIRETKVKEDTVHDKWSHMADAARYCLYTYTI